MTLCLDTARNAVAFLVECFPKLQYAHLGGYTPDRKDFIKLTMEDRTHNDLSYFPQYCRRQTEDHQGGIPRDAAGLLQCL